jgi:hypothetical protein
MLLSLQVLLLSIVPQLHLLFSVRLSLDRLIEVMAFVMAPAGGGCYGRTREA